MRRNTMAAALICALLSFGPVSAAPTPLPADLAQALEAYHRATTSNDTRALAALVTEDYVLVNSDASIQDKASYLADFAVPGFKLDPYEVERPIYRVRGDAALTAWTFRLSWTQDGRHQSRRLRIAHVWVSEQGRWRIAYTQLTRIAD
jgi:ketosteroid isomerase-like protein